VKKTISEKKRILFIAPKLNGYETRLSKEMESMGYSVTLFSEKPDILQKYIVQTRLPLKYRCKIADSYFKGIIKSIDNQKFDYLFVIRGEYIPLWFLNLFSVKNPDARKILYQWDSIRNNPNAEKMAAFFDKCYTFDWKDSEKFPKFIYKPLFYVREYDPNNLGKEPETDLFFIGILHGKRYQIVKEIIQKAQLTGLTTNFKFLITKSGFFCRKIFDATFKNAQKSEFVFNLVGIESVSKMLHNSKCVVDICHPDQTGLTMRTFEALGAGKKLLTTNKNILREKFYNPAIVQLLDPDNIVLDLNFIKSENSRDLQILKYRIDNWLYDFFV
jgi:hypothetical protein